MFDMRLNLSSFYYLNNKITINNYKFNNEFFKLLSENNNGDNQKFFQKKIYRFKSKDD